MNSSKPSRTTIKLTSRSKPQKIHNNSNSTQISKQTHQHKHSPQNQTEKHKHIQVEKDSVIIPIEVEKYSSQNDSISQLNIHIKNINQISNPNQMASSADDNFSISDSPNSKPNIVEVVFKSPNAHSPKMNITESETTQATQSALDSKNSEIKPKKLFQEEPDVPYQHNRLPPTEQNIIKKNIKNEFSFGEATQLNQLLPTSTQSTQLQNPFSESITNSTTPQTTANSNSQKRKIYKLKKSETLSKNKSRQKNVYQKSSTMSFYTTVNTSSVFSNTNDILSTMEEAKPSNDKANKKFLSRMERDFLIRKLRKEFFLEWGFELQNPNSQTVQEANINIYRRLLALNGVDLEKLNSQKLTPEEAWVVRRAQKSKKQQKKIEQEQFENEYLNKQSPEHNLRHKLYSSQMKKSSVSKSGCLFSRISHNGI